MVGLFFTIAAVSPRRQRSFRFAVVAHLGLLTTALFAVAWAPPSARAVILGSVLITAGILEGAILVGWRLSQFPKGIALEFLLASPLGPTWVLLGETIVGLVRLGLVTLAGLPILLLAIGEGYFLWRDLLPLLLMPLTWGAITGLGLTVWAYESRSVRRWAQRGLVLALVAYLTIGVLAGERLGDWIECLPPVLARGVLNSVEAFHRFQPFAQLRSWLTELPAAVEQTWWNVEGGALLLAGFLGWRCAWRLSGHFQDLHYGSQAEGEEKARPAVGEHPLSWWASQRVTRYSGWINLYIAGGFGLLYALYSVAGTHWPSWLGRQVFVVLENAGGIPLWSTALVVLAAVPAAFQYGLWDSSAQERCRRLELLLLTSLTIHDYWQAAACAAWRRGRGYLAIALLLWSAAAAAGAVPWSSLAGAWAAGTLLWALYFAFGFRAFARGREGNGVGLGLTLGLPLLAFGIWRIGWPEWAQLAPPAAVFAASAGRIGVAWMLACTAAAGIFAVLRRRLHSEGDLALRRWYDQHHGRKLAE